jgi:tRNA pseudouridine55 synthase
MAIDGIFSSTNPPAPRRTTSSRACDRRRRAQHRYTGTLDPRATGRCARAWPRDPPGIVLLGQREDDEATIRFVATDTDDAAGRPQASRRRSGRPTLRWTRRWTDFADVFAGASQHSAKKIGGAKAYDLARRGIPVDLAPVTVTVHLLEVLERSRDDIRVRVRVSAGFYVRALARDLGSRLGCGAHLSQLRRTACGGFDIGAAITLAEAERLGRGVTDSAQAIALLRGFGSVTVLNGHIHQVMQKVEGNVSLHTAMSLAYPLPSPGQRVRILGPGGVLLAVAESRGGALHPVVVLG